MTNQQNFTVGDIFVSPKTRGTYRVVRIGAGGILGERTTEQDAIRLACAERAGKTVWSVGREDGALVAVQCADNTE